jgi:hypothetical protein
VVVAARAVPAVNSPVALNAAAAAAPATALLRSIVRLVKPCWFMVVSPSW